jgi:TPR repeat protein
MTKPFAQCSLPDFAHEFALWALVFPSFAKDLHLPCFTNKELTEEVLQRHPLVQGASGLVCSDTEESERAWCNMLADLFNSAGVAVSDSHRQYIYAKYRECAKSGRVRVCAFIADLMVHPAFPLMSGRWRELVAELAAHPVYCLASQVSVERWEHMFRRRIPSQVRARQWHVTGIGIRLQQRRTLLCRGALCATLVLRLMCFQGECTFRHTDRPKVAERILSRRHFLGPSRNFAECLFLEGQRLCGEQRYFDAVERWEQAALLQHGPAHAYLSFMLFYGRPGVCQDGRRAFMFASAGAKLGCAHSKGALGDCYIDGVGVAEDAAKGFALAKESEVAGSCFGQAVVAGCFNHGICVKRDYAEASRLYRLAAAQGHAVAQNNLAMFFYNGKGVEQDDAEAALLFRLAAHQGDPEAQKNLGRMFQNGRGVAQDHEEAVRLFRLAAAQGHTEADLILKFELKLESPLSSLFPGLP